MASLGYFDEADGTAYWHPPRSSHELGPPDLERPFEAPDDTLARSLGHLVAQRRDLPAGTFVFVVSDFLVQPSRDQWLYALERRWEIVPVVVQDPVWEQSFPDVAGAVVPFLDAGTGARGARPHLDRGGRAAARGERAALRRPHPLPPRASTWTPCSSRRTTIARSRSRS